MARLWLRRCRVEYLISSHRSFASFGQEVARCEDPALDQLVHRDLTDPPRRIWSIIKLDDPVPEARVALRAETVANHADLVGRLCVRDEPDLAMFLAEDRVPAEPTPGLRRSNPGTARRRRSSIRARVIWSSPGPSMPAGGRRSTMARSSVLPVNGGFQAVRVEGSGTHLIRLWYAPPWFLLYLVISLIALAVIAGIIIAGVCDVGQGQDGKPEGSFHPGRYSDIEGGRPDMRLTTGRRWFGAGAKALIVVVASVSFSTLEGLAAYPKAPGFKSTEQMVPMRDGVKLHTLIFSPEQAQGLCRSCSCGLLTASTAGPRSFQIEPERAGRRRLYLRVPGHPGEIQVRRGRSS